MYLLVVHSLLLQSENLLTPSRNKFSTLSLVKIKTARNIKQLGKDFHVEILQGKEALDYKLRVSIK